MIVIPGFAHHVTKHLHVALPVRSVHHLTVSFPGQYSPGTSQPYFPLPLTLSLTPSFLQLIMHRVGLESGCTPSCCVAPDTPLRASELQAPQLDIGDDGAGHHSVSQVGNPAGRQ